MLTAQRSLPVGGLTPLTTVDWPDRLAAVVHTRGCPWRCPYCHNPELQQVAGQGYDWTKVLGFLNTRRGLLDGVVFTGGEPCLHPALADALQEVRALGFGTALHTGGAFPDRLAELLEGGLVDWIGLDVKAPFEDYQACTEKSGSGERANRSLSLVIDSGVPYEVRTTVYEPLLTAERLDKLAIQLAGRGVTNWVLQPCIEHPNAPPRSAPGLFALAERLRPVTGPIEVRV
jgi:pyruvate formate lyase activating enzyme